MVLLVGGYCIIAASVGDTELCCTKLKYINLKERTEPGPSNADSGAWTAASFSEFYLKTWKSA